MRKAVQFPVRAVLVATMVVLGFTACGDDDDEAATDTTTTTAAGSDTKEYCEKALALETTAPPDIDFEALSPEQQKEAVKTFVREDISPLVDEIEKVIPEPIEAEAGVLVAGIDKVEQTGDFQAFENDPQIQKAEETVHAFDLDNCGWGRNDVAGVDYAFEGIPSTMKAGVHSFEFSNKGKELHMIAVVRAKDEVTESFDQILELPQEQAGEKIDFIGETSAPPGEKDYFVGDLKPGRYLAVCFIATGTVAEDKEGDGPPHFVKGMRTEFKVS